MNTFVHTESGSTYEIDPENNRARRLGNTGGSLPTQRFGEDEQWNPYKYLARMAWPDGKVSLVFWWDTTGYTRTSPMLDPESVAFLFEDVTA